MGDISVTSELDIESLTTLRNFVLSEVRLGSCGRDQFSAPKTTKCQSREIRKNLRKSGKIQKIRKNVGLSEIFLDFPRIFQKIRKIILPDFTSCSALSPVATRIRPSPGHEVAWQSWCGQSPPVMIVRQPSAPCKVPATGGLKLENVPVRVGLDDANRAD